MKLATHRANGIAGLTIGVIQFIADLAEDEHLNGRSVFWSDDRQIGSYRAPSVVPHRSRTPESVARDALKLGQDSAEVLGRVLGYDDERLRGLMSRGVVA